MKNLSKREKVYVAVFAVALLWGIWNYKDMIFGGGDATKQPKPAAAAVQPRSAVVRTAGPSSQAPAIQRAVATGVHGDAPAWDGDPFHRDWRYRVAPVVVKQTQQRKSGPPLKLSAVVVRPGSKYAVINGSIVREGGRVGGRTVTRIEESKVIVDDHGVEVTLYL